MPRPVPSPRRASPALRVFAPQDPAARGPRPPEPPRLTPQATLGEFFERWFRPVVLEGHRDAAQNTLLIYADAVRWWRSLTGDPPLAAIDEFVVAEFQARLRTATFRRGPQGAERPLSRASQRKLLAQLRAILYRVGPTVDPRRPTSRLLAEVPYVVVGAAPRQRPKDHFTLAEVQRIAATAATTGWGAGPGSWARPALAAPRLWRATLALWFYTGLRAGTALALRRRHLVEDAGGWWLAVPDELVPKTHKGLRKAVHPVLLRELRAVAAEADQCGLGDDRLVPWPYGYRHLLALHARLAAAAGLPPARHMSPQAWRRTHAAEMARIGARHGLLVAQRALDHADAAITREHYVDLEPELIRGLPDMFPAADDRQQRLF